MFDGVTMNSALLFSLKSSFVRSAAFSALATIVSQLEGGSQETNTVAKMAKNEQQARDKKNHRNILGSSFLDIMKLLTAPRNAYENVSAKPAITKYRLKPSYYTNMEESIMPHLLFPPQRCSKDS